jgi:hypothetical protein
MTPTLGGHIPNAKDYRPDKDGMTINLIGVPKAGKSHFARTATKVGKVFALMAPQELPGYAGFDVDYEIVQPTAEGWERANAILKEFEDGKRTANVLVLDTANVVIGDALWRWVLRSYNVSDPKELGARSRDVYMTYGMQMEAVLNRLIMLRFSKKLHVIALWHEDIREFEGLGVARKEEEKTGAMSRTVTHWDLARVPMARGAIRQIITQWFDFSFYVEPVVGSKPHRARLVVVPQDMTRQLAGVRLDVIKQLQALSEVTNDFEVLVKIVEQRYGNAK